MNDDLPLKHRAPTPEEVTAIGSLLLLTGHEAGGLHGRIIYAERQDREQPAQWTKLEEEIPS